MRTCPTCGYTNPQAVSRCEECHEPLPPISLYARSLPIVDAALGRVSALLVFLLGVGLDLGIGFVVAAVTPLAVSSNVCFLFLGMLVLGGLFAVPRKTRLFGYGLLAGALTVPIWSQNACTPTQYFR